MHPWPENYMGDGESFPGTTHPSSPQDDVDTHHPVKVLSDFATAQQLFFPSKLISHLWGDPLRARKYPRPRNTPQPRFSVQG